MARIGIAVAPIRCARALGCEGGAGSGRKRRGRGVKKETAPPVLLAHRWENDIDLTGWWMSEKLDGVRAYWNGTSFLSRLATPSRRPIGSSRDCRNIRSTASSGRPQDVPGHDVDRAPLRQERRLEESEVRPFDAPGHGGPFEKRLEFLQKNFKEGRLPYCKAIAQEQVRDMKPSEGRARASRGSRRRRIDGPPAR